MKRSSQYRSILLATASLMLISAPAMAQSAGAPAAAPEANTLGEIVVTARRVKENLQSVPVSVTAFSPDSLRQANISSAQDLTQVTPGAFLQSSGSPSNSEYSIRGQSKPVAGASPSNAGVVSYFNDVPLTNYLSSTPQFDMSSVQILKGPQGTLFGRNTTGGAVLLYSAVPTYRFGGYVQATYGNYDDREIEGAINVPLIEDKVALRLAGRIDRHDGYVRNQGVGGDLENEWDENFRVSLLLHPVSWLTNTTIFDTADAPFDKNTGGAQTLIAVPLAASLAPTPLGLVFPSLQNALNLYNSKGPWYTNSNVDTRNGWRSAGVSNKTVVDLPYGMSFINIFGHREIHYSTVVNFDGAGAAASALPGVFPNEGGYFFDDNQTENLKQDTDEMQLHGKSFGGRLTWLLGAFVFDSEPGNGAFGGGGSLQDLGAPLGSFGYGFYSEHSTAGFINVNYDLSDFVQGLKFNAGYRYSWDRYSACSGDTPFLTLANGYANLSPNLYNVGPTQCDAAHLQNVSRGNGASSAPTWTVGLDWQASHDLFLYVTARQGYRAGGINTPALGPTFVAEGLQSFHPEKILDQEIGFKSDKVIMGWSTRLDVSLFHSDTTNEQVIGTQIQTSGKNAAGVTYCSVGTPPNATPVWIDGDCNLNNDPTQTTLTINGQETKLYGMEGNLTVSPFHDLVVDLGGSLLGDKVVSSPPAVIAAFFPHDELLFTPKYTFAGDLHYTLPINPDWGKFVYSFNYYRSGDVDLGGVIAPAYNIFNMRLDWNNVLNSPVDLSAFVKNLSDTRYLSGPAFTGTNTPYETVQFGIPRTFGVVARYRFGG